MIREGAHRVRSHGRPAAAVLLLSSLVLLVSGGCQSTEPEVGTALFVTAGFDPALHLDQFRVEGDVGDALGSVGPTLLPEQPGRELMDGETFRVLLPDAPDGARVTLKLKGLRGSEPVAEGQAETQVSTGREVDVRVRLEALAGGPPDGGGSFCTGCEDGCCQNGVCATRTVGTCGVGGVACVACDGVRADTCSAQGACACGTGPACAGDEVDRCVTGECRCGAGGPCGPGQACVNGQCRCGNGPACGLGQACVDGQCRCGDGPACGTGQACVDGQCQCTPESCPNGCCAGNTCEPGTELDVCGTGGEACQQCRRECKEDHTCR